MCVCLCVCACVRVVCMHVCTCLVYPRVYTYARVCICVYTCVCVCRVYKVFCVRQEASEDYLPINSQKNCISKQSTDIYTHINWRENLATQGDNALCISSCVTMHRCHLSVFMGHLHHMVLKPFNV